MTAFVLHLGGNGHAEVRLTAARAALQRAGGQVELIDVPYPGFEGRPKAASREAFLEEIGGFCNRERANVRAAYASGIGGLIALGLRARGDLRVPLILQAPVLWGLERRWFPRLMTWAVARELLHQCFGREAFQRRFARTHFLAAHDPAWLSRFFQGYRDCGAFGDLFAWFTPSYLRELERQFAARGEALARVRIWWGGRDTVVDLEELRLTERALHVTWPVTIFPTWGHYPMIDQPEEWADALRDALAPALRVPR